MSVVNWLDEQPVGLVLLGLFALSLVLAVGLTYLADRFFEDEARSITSSSVTTAVGVVAALYGVLAAFIIVNEWQAFDDAQATISDESAALADAFATASVLPEPGRSEIQNALIAYERSVVCVEIPYLRTHEGPAPETRDALQDLYRTIAEHEPIDSSEFYGNEVDALSEITEARSARIDSALSPIPGVLLVAVLVTGIALIASVSALDTKHRRWHLVITTALILIVAINLWLVITLDRPFDGAAAVDDRPLREGISASSLDCS